MPGNGPATLNRQIIAQRRTADVLAICGLRVSEFDFVTAVTALHRMAKSPQGRSGVAPSSPHLMRRLEDIISGGLGNAEPPSLSNSAWALSKLHWDHRPLLHSTASSSIARITDLRP